MLAALLAASAEAAAACTRDMPAVLPASSLALAAACDISSAVLPELAAASAATFAATSGPGRVQSKQRCEFGAFLDVSDGDVGGWGFRGQHDFVGRRENRERLPGGRRRRHRRHRSGRSGGSGHGSLGSSRSIGSVQQRRHNAVSQLSEIHGCR